MVVAWHRAQSATVSLLGDCRPPCLVVAGSLDDSAAAAMWAMCERLIANEPHRVDLDLSSVTDVSSAGVLTVGRCLQAGRGLAGGVRVVVASAAGRRALRESMALV
jgi:ABC-type transporter Mla MlaB component